MNEYELLKSVETPENPNIPDLRSGDMVSVFIRIQESGNERVQVVETTLTSPLGGLLPTVLV